MNGYTSCPDPQKVVRQIDAVTAGSAFCMLKEENVDWIHLAQGRGHWLTVNMLMNGNESMGCITCW
jgi:hypothetical protein